MWVSAKALAKLVIMGGHLEGLDVLRNRKHKFQMSRSVTLCLVLSVLAWPALAKPPVVSGSAYVIDGDTLVIGRRHIRLFGIDAFEHDQTCGRFRCGVEATSALRALIQGQTITCQQQDRDQYGRIVAICKLPSGLDLGAEMVRRGLAVDYRRFTLDYMDEEADAKAHKRGAWARGFQSPLRYRREHPR
jgi:endonuclease YncB( thermonuclease family)